MLVDIIYNYIKTEYRLFYIFDTESKHHSLSPLSITTIWSAMAEDDGAIITFNLLKYFQANDTAALKDVIDSQNAAGVLLLAVKAANRQSFTYFFII